VAEGVEAGLLALDLLLQDDAPFREGVQEELRGLLVGAEIAPPDSHPCAPRWRVRLNHRRTELGDRLPEVGHCGLGPRVVLPVEDPVPGVRASEYPVEQAPLRS